MGIEHQLARMTAKGLQITGEGFGGTADLSQTDVAAAMAGLKIPAYWYMRVKFCGDAQLHAPLQSALVYQMLGEAMSGEYDISVQAAGKLANLAILQATTGPICPVCNGTGTVMGADTVADCGECRGSGRLTMTQERAAGIAGVSVPTYKKRYARIVDAYVARLDQYESQGLSHVRRRLYGERG